MFVSLSSWIKAESLISKTKTGKWATCWPNLDESQFVHQSPFQIKTFLLVKSMNIEKTNWAKNNNIFCLWSSCINWCIFWCLSHNGRDNHNNHNNNHRPIMTSGRVDSVRKIRDFWTINLGQSHLFVPKMPCYSSPVRGIQFKDWHLSEANLN